MYKIDNMTITEYLKDRFFIYFRPLLCCTSLKENLTKKECVCPISLFSDTAINTLKNHNLVYGDRAKIAICIDNETLQQVTSVNILNNKSLNILKNNI